ncbi:D-alanyl-D-alanine carboxypeptidase/D-alanyl-D-alanine-endopeptidase [Nocardioides sp. ChNu-153]|uniref:D-alanyl-D-alanine carboxypeptidase/D-alanyl-D-alanine endopeptidase n=1 Tax=unclassified Nocardioides TaxID=2615069 RepID=UPI002407506C|nr:MULTISPECIES: D-alanyl-D-alanine carboxypeptidase/D-alanyl-D-alanine-endopeptidase [unclassified Nocardioides]MDF9716256.1 D-alanyl-D-alanine carboxypeptidase/D-alanyl-D-alanine-endopeptidase [Nocardioides sp. ChNu-99]MDN7122002.1 D-alanyl-D-alanine carboxypeptidase/D-alanyl-D-alanine-endopeptidase [Nocardioides sp. ChNu-153]
MAVGQGRRRGSGRGRRLPLVLALVVVLLAVAGAAAWRLDLLDGVLGDDGSGGPAAVAPPEGLDLPPLADPDPLLTPVTATAGAVDPQAVAAAMAPYLAEAGLGPQVMVGVAPLGEGTPYLAGAERVVPASTTKLLTAVAALEALGGDHRFTTRVVDGGASDAVAGVRRVVLVGGGDPLLAREPVPAEDAASTYPARASLRDLADRTAAALVADGVTSVEVAYDASLFTGPAINPAWPASYVPDGVVPPITALWADRGYVEDEVVADPAADAAAWFARALVDAGVEVVATPAPGLGGNGTTLAEVDSTPVANLVEHLLAISDNETTEVLAHHVGLQVEGAGTFEGGAAGVRRVLADLGVDLGADVLRDGSGLSRENQLSATTLLGVLGVAVSSEHPELRAAVTGLPVAGFSGSLANRFDDADPAGLGTVRAKTGTLTGVQGLAGVVEDATGTPLRFVVVADRVDLPSTLDARQALDRAVAALAACTCSTSAAGPAATPSTGSTGSAGAPATTG